MHRRTCRPSAPARPAVHAVAVAWLLAWCLAAEEPLPEVRPVPADPPVSADVRAEFDTQFAEDIAAALATPAPDDDGALAARVFLEAKSRAADRAWVAMALDHVVRLAGRSPDHQDLAYAALRTQCLSRLRPRDKCYAKLMGLVPRVLDQLDAASRSEWIERVATPDALQFAGLKVERRSVAEAARLLDRFAEACADAGVEPPAAVAENARGLRLLAEAQGDSSLAASPVPSVYRAAALLQRGAPLEQVAARLADSSEEETQVLGTLLAKAAGSKASSELRQRILLAAGSIELPPLVRRLVVRSLSSRLTASGHRLAQQEFFGVDIGGASRIVFVVDHSGSMSPRLRLAREQLRQAVRSLSAGQRFHIIFFDTGAVEMPGPAPVPATAEHKQAAYRFIDSIGSGGGTNPSRALERAFAIQPDTVNLVTDGEFDEQIAELIADLNRSRRTTVNTICIESPSGAPVLERIALEHNGTFRMVKSQTAP